MKITGDAYFKCSFTLACQCNRVIIFHHAHTVTDTFRAKFFNRFPYIRGRPPFAGMDRDMQPGLPGFLENTIEWFRLELSFIASQVDTDQPPINIISSDPRNLFGQFRAFVAVDRDDQPDADRVVLLGAGGFFTHTGDHVLVAVIVLAGQGVRGEAEFHVRDVVGGGVFDHLARDAPDDLGRAVKLAQHIEFAEEGDKNTVAGMVKDYENLFVIRSVTKFYGLAGLRFGYAIAADTLKDKLETMRQPWSINGLACQVTMAAFNDTEFINGTKETINKNKAQLAADLSSIEGLHVYPSTTNFLLVKITNRKLTSTMLKELLAKERILVRDCCTFMGMDDSYFRVTIRSAKDNQILVKKIKQFLAESNR